MNVKFEEKDMYMPVKSFFERLGYAVNGEVKDCDMTLVKDNELVIVEMKKNFTIDLLIQALDRQTITDNVYVVIPRPSRLNTDKRNGVIRLMKRLSLGLLYVAMDSPVKLVEVVVFPENADTARTKRGRARKESILREISGRSGDFNAGGSTRRKISTAYREKCIKILCVMERTGEEKPAGLRNLYNCDEKTRGILASNVYGWFYRIDKGLYGISAKGWEFLTSGEFKELVDYYRNEIEQTLSL